MQTLCRIRENTNSHIAGLAEDTSNLSGCVAVIDLGLSVGAEFSSANPAAAILGGVHRVELLDSNPVPGGVDRLEARLNGFNVSFLLCNSFADFANIVKPIALATIRPKFATWLSGIAVWAELFGGNLNLMLWPARHQFSVRRHLGAITHLAVRVNSALSLPALGELLQRENLVTRTAMFSCFHRNKWYHNALTCARGV
jgi:hypothetical protein